MNDFISNKKESRKIKWKKNIIVWKKRAGRARKEFKKKTGIKNK